MKISLTSEELYLALKKASEAHHEFEKEEKIRLAKELWDSDLSIRNYDPKSWDELADWQQRTIIEEYVSFQDDWAKWYTDFIMNKYGDKTPHVG